MYYNVARDRISVLQRSYTDYFTMVKNLFV